MAVALDREIESGAAVSAWRRRLWELEPWPAGARPCPERGPPPRGAASEPVMICPGENRRRSCDR